MSEAEELRLLRMGYDAQRHMLAKLEAQRDELLAALKSCQSACERAIEQDGGVLGGIDFHALNKGVSAAIAKATGQVAK